MFVKLFKTFHRFELQQFQITFIRQKCKTNLLSVNYYSLRVSKM